MMVSGRKRVPMILSVFRAKTYDDAIILISPCFTALSQQTSIGRVQIELHRDVFYVTKANRYHPVKFFEVSQLPLVVPRCFHQKMFLMSHHDHGIKCHPNQCFDENISSNLHFRNCLARNAFLKFSFWTRFGRFCEVSAFITPQTRPKSRSG